MASAYCITRQQRNTHLVFEGLAVFTAVPFYVWLATRGRELNKSEKAGLLALAAGTALVDGTLLARYSSLRPRRSA